MHTARISRFHVIWLLSYISIASVSAAIITPALPEIQLQYHLNLGALEWIVSAFLVGYVVGQLMYGPLANQFGRIKALRVGLLINLVGIVVCIAADRSHSYWLLLMGRLITGLGAASGLACTFMLINEWLPESQRKTAMAYSVASFALAMGLAVSIGGLITQYLHWQVCFWFLLVHGFVMLLGTSLFSETLITPKPIRIATIFRDYSLALSSRKLVVFSLVLGCCAVISYCFSAAGPQIAQDKLTLSAAEYGYWNGLNVLGMLMGGILAKQVLTRLSIRAVIAIGFLGVGFGIGNLTTMWATDHLSALWFFLTTATLFLFSSFLYGAGSLIASNAIEDKASAAAMMSFLNMCFATFSVILMGYLGHNPLLNFILILCLVCLLVGGCLLVKSAWVAVR